MNGVPNFSPAPRIRWYHKAFAVFFALFTIELGVFLVVAPWTGIWDRNALAKLAPRCYELWLSPYVRGAVSGVGIVNLWVALAEVIALRRYWVK